MRSLPEGSSYQARDGDLRHLHRDLFLGSPSKSTPSFQSRRSTREAGVVCHLTSGPHNRSIPRAAISNQGSKPEIVTLARRASSASAEEASPPENTMAGGNLIWTPTGHQAIR